MSFNFSLLEKSSAVTFELFLRLNFTSSGLLLKSNTPNWISLAISSANISGHFYNAYSSISLAITITSYNKNHRNCQCNNYGRKY